MKRTTMLMMLLTMAASAGAEVVTPNWPKMSEQVAVGSVTSVDLVNQPGSRLLTTRVKTAEGRTYYAHGVMNGMEGTALTIETARNGVRYLCGGLPKNCNALAE
jgi:hypothetical protein